MTYSGDPIGGPQHSETLAVGWQIEITFPDKGPWSHCLGLPLSVRRRQLGGYHLCSKPVSYLGAP